MAALVLTACGGSPFVGSWPVFTELTMMICPDQLAVVDVTKPSPILIVDGPQSGSIVAILDGVSETFDVLPTDAAAARLPTDGGSNVFTIELDGGSGTLVLTYDLLEVGSHTLSERAEGTISLGAGPSCVFVRRIDF